MPRTKPLAMAAILQALCAAPVIAAGAPAATATHPDLTGVWQPAGRNLPKDLALTPVDQPAGSERTNYRFDLLQPWAADVVHKLRDSPDKQNNQASLNCISSGLPLNWQHPRGYHIYETPEQVVLVEEAFHDIEFVYMNAKHPANLKPSWIGHSIGHWEKDALVIDTVGFNDKGGIDDTGTPRSDKLHLTTRMKLLGDGKYLEAVFTLDDPKVFIRPITTSKYFVKNDLPMGEQICEPETDQHLNLLGKGYTNLIGLPSAGQQGN